MPYSVEPMRLSDVTQVEVIERQSFTSPWSRRAYQYDLTQNPLARYLVVREREGEDNAERREQAPARRAWWGHRAWGAARRFWHTLAGGFLTWLAGRGSGGTGAPAELSDSSPPILGFAGMWLAVGEAHVVTIAVRPESRGRGLGELLLASLIDLACQLEVSTLYLEVRVSNVGAKRLYEKYGFVGGRLRKRYYSDNGEDALEMIAEGITTGQYQSRLQLLKHALALKLAGGTPAQA